MAGEHVPSQPEACLSHVWGFWAVREGESSFADAVRCPAPAQATGLARYGPNLYGHRTSFCLWNV